MITLAWPLACNDECFYSLQAVCIPKKAQGKSTIRGTIHLIRPSSRSYQTIISSSPSISLLHLTSLLHLNALYIWVLRQQPRAGCACDLGLRDFGHRARHGVAWWLATPTTSPPSGQRRARSSRSSPAGQMRARSSRSSASRWWGPLELCKFLHMQRTTTHTPSSYPAVDAPCGDMVSHVSVGHSTCSLKLRMRGSATSWRRDRYTQAIELCCWGSDLSPCLVEMAGDPSPWFLYRACRGLACWKNLDWHWHYVICFLHCVLVILWWTELPADHWNMGFVYFNIVELKKATWKSCVHLHRQLANMTFSSMWHVASKTRV
jgi:hypothetical protein